MTDVEPNATSGKPAAERSGVFAWVKGNKGVAQRIAISGVALGLLLVGLIDPGRINEWTIALLVVAVLPWLAPLVDYIQVSKDIKVKFRETVKQTEDARDKAESQAQRALQQAKYAQSAAEEAKTRVIELETRLEGTEKAPPEAPKGAAPTVPAETIEKLAQDYDDLRRKPYGSARTSAMTKVVQGMMAAAEQDPSFDVSAALHSQAGRGMRLAGYAALYRNPNPVLLTALVDVAIDLEDKNFGRYWAIRAIGKVIDRLNGKSPDVAVVRRLRQWQQDMGPGSDRYYALTRILDQVDAGTGTRD